MLSSIQSNPIPSAVIPDERRAFVDAAAKYARVDEAIARTPELAGLHRSISIRKEAMYIASLEGESARDDSLARLVGDVESTFIERGAKTAFDLHQAIKVASDLSESPTSQQIIDIFRISEVFKSRLMKADMVWTLEEDASFVEDLCSRLVETPEPWLAVETVRRIWISGRFFGCARRIAMIFAPWCVATGFGGRHRLLGLTDALAKSSGGLREIEADPDVWAINFAVAISRASTVQHELLGSVAGLTATMHALCPHERSSSSISSAIGFFIAFPISSAKHFSQTLGLTSRGAKVVLDKMVSSGILEIEGGSRNRSYISRRSL
jgi:hypothetical protein